MNNGLNPDNLDAVILCGGLGTRLRSVLRDKPKPMADFNDRPFLDLLIEYVGRFGFQRFILCSGHQGGLIKDYFESKNDDNTYIVSQETSPLGTAGAIKHAESLINSDNFLALNGDSFCEINLTSFVSFHLSKNALASLALATMKDSTDYGGVVLGENNEILSFDEKKNAPSPGWINAGIYMFNKKVLNHIPTKKQFSLEQDVFPSLTEKGLFGFPSQSRLLDIGTPERLERARQLLIHLN